MANEQAIAQELLEKFPYFEGKINISGDRRLWIEVETANFFEVFDYVVKKMDFPMLGLITGLDSGDNLEFIYHLSRFDGTMLNLKIFIPKANPVFKSVVVDYFPGAELYEREIVDCFGARFEGLPEGKRYPLPDDWPEGQYPMFEDWKE